MIFLKDYILYLTSLTDLTDLLIVNNPIVTQKTTPIFTGPHYPLCGDPTCPILNGNYSDLTSIKYQNLHGE